jgi:hypothetical protein
MAEVRCVNCESTNVEPISTADWKRPNKTQAELFLCNDCDCEWEE